MNKMISARLTVPIVMNAMLAFAFFAFWINALRSGITWQADFTNYYTGWKIILNGDSSYLYDMSTQLQYQQNILGNGRQFADGLLPFVSPPHLSWQTAPLAFLPLQWAYLLWSFVNAIVLIACIRILLNMVKDWQPSSKIAMITAICGFYPLYSVFLLNTFALISILALLSMFIADQRQRPTITAAWLILATIRFQYIVFVGIWLLATRRWRVLGWATVYGALLAAITTVLLGWEVWGDYLQLLSFHSQSFDRFGIYPAEAYTLKGTLTLLVGRSAASRINLIAQIAFVVTAAGLGWWFWRHPSRERSEAGWQYGLAILLNLLLSLHLNHHDALLLVIPAFFMTLWLQQHGKLTSGFVAFVLSCPLLFFVTDLTIGKMLGVQIPVLLMIGLLGWMVIAHRRTHEAIS